MFKTRLLSGIVLVILAVALIYFGGDVLLFSMFLISVIGMYELYRIFSVEKALPGFVGYLTALVYYCNFKWNFLSDMMPFFLGCMILLMFVFVLAYPKYHSKQIFAVFFGVFYVAVMLSYVYQLRQFTNGLYLAFLIFFCSWGCDTCAYCVGVLFGKHKMSPKLSPKKSVEGAIGGVAGSAALTAIYCMIFQSQMKLETNQIAVLAVIAAIAGLVSMIGDLCASAIKRNYDIKDYGKLIPGHGGILDRFDSMIITAPIIYYLAMYLL